MSDNVKKYKISIFGESYSILSDEREEKFIAAAHMVDQYMRNIAEKGVSDSKRIAILAALQIASRAVEAEEQLIAHNLSYDHLIDLIQREVSL